MMNKKQPVSRCLLLASILMTATACTTTQQSEQPAQPVNSGQAAATFPVKSPTFGGYLASLENRSYAKDIHVKVSALHNSVKLGKTLKFKLESDVDGYASLYIFQKSGKVHALLENARIHAGQSKIYPDDYVNLVLRARPPVGANAVLLLGSEQPIQGTIKRNGSYLSKPTQIRSTQFGAVSDIDNQVSYLPQSQWDSDLIEISIHK